MTKTIRLEDEKTVGNVDSLLAIAAALDNGFNPDGILMTLYLPDSKANRSNRWNRRKANKHNRHQKD